MNAAAELAQQARQAAELREVMNMSMETVLIVLVVVLLLGGGGWGYSRWR